MKTVSKGIGANVSTSLMGQPSARMPFISFLMRYPIYLLAFGPPTFRSSVGIDATKGVLDVWAFIQAFWIAAITFISIYRILTAGIIYIPQKIRNILILATILGLLFSLSALYSPSRSVSFAYSLLYFMTLISIIAFIADAYISPPDWMQCLLYMRRIMLVLYAMIIIALIVDPKEVMVYIPGVGIRLGGGTIAPISLVCPTIAIISAYYIVYSLEPKAKSIIYFVSAFAGTLITQSRGAELTLLLPLVIVGVLWASSSKRSSYLFISSALTLLVSTVLAVAYIGGERVWNLINRNQSLEGIKSASGRTDIWKFVIAYCLSHPLGMGYIAGFRIYFKSYFALGIQVDTSRIGASHNSFIDVLADAGWPALAIYLCMLFLIVLYGWSSANMRPLGKMSAIDPFQHVIRCSLLLLFSFFINGMDTSDFSVPLRTSFYLQFIVISMILVYSANIRRKMRADLFMYRELSGLTLSHSETL